MTVSKEPSNFNPLFWRTLKPGDCGTIIYIKEGDVFRPAGMLVGEVLRTASKPGFSSPVYQAIVLSQAFKDIECDYKHQVANIKLLITKNQCTTLLKEDHANLSDFSNISRLKKCSPNSEKRNSYILW